MKWERAVHHVESAAQEAARVHALSVSFDLLPVTALWAVGEVLGAPVDLERVSVALSVDLPAAEVPWWTVPKGGEHWLNMTGLAKNPVILRWRSTRVPVWNHRIVRPLLVWDCVDGVREEALAALREGRGAAAGLAEPTDTELAERLRDELAVSLAAVRRSTQVYGERRWAPGKLTPLADALWTASDGYLDLLDAVGDTVITS